MIVVGIDWVQVYGEGVFFVLLVVVDIVQIIDVQYGGCQQIVGCCWQKNGCFYIMGLQILVVEDVQLVEENEY